MELKALSHTGPFQKMVIKVFAPSMKDYLETNELPLKALFLLGSAPGHPKDLEDNLLADFPWQTFSFCRQIPVC